MQFTAKVEDMLKAQKDERSMVTIETPQFVAHLKRVMVKHDGLGLVIYKPGPKDDKGNTDPDKIYLQGRISHVGLDDEITYSLTGKSWFYHGEANTTVTIK